MPLDCTTDPQHYNEVLVPRCLSLLGAVVLANASVVLMASCVAQRGVPGSADVTAAMETVVQQNSALDSLLSAVQREYGSPAIAAGVVSGDALITAGAIGVRSLASDERIQITDAFHLGSVSKPVSATLVAILVERGMISWSATPVDVFAEMEDVIHPSLATVTLAQLFAHTAGLPNYNPGRPEWEALPVLEGSATEQRATFARWVLSRPPVRSPGSGFLYSNAGSPIAAAMAERVTGRSWENLMRELVFAPLGLETAGFGWPAAHDLRGPWGHWEEGGQLQPHNPQGDYQIPIWMRPAGDIHMSVVDFARFAALHLKGLSGAAGLLRPQTVHELHMPVASRTEMIDHGLGWHVWSEQAGPRAGRSFHAGGGGTFVAFVEILPALELGFVIMTNDGREPSRVVAAIRSGLEEIFATSGTAGTGPGV